MWEKEANVKKYRQFSVGNITLIKDGDNLEFRGAHCAQNPDHVIIAMIVVSRYLRWHKGPFKNEVLVDSNGTVTASKEHESTYQEWHKVWIGDVDVNEAIWKDNIKPYMVNVTASTTGRTIYVNGMEVMHICSTGNTDWCKMSKNQIIGAINDWYYNKNTILIPSYAFSIQSMFRVTKVDPYIEFDEDDYYRVDKMFIEFMESHCKEPGTYSFKNDEFLSETGLQTKGMVWYYLTNRHEFTTFNGQLCVSSVVQNEDTIEITLK